MKIKKFSKGQSLVELLVVIGIFITVIAGLVFFVFDSFSAGRLSYDLIKANFLAEEGIEAARSIRDNNFSNLIAGNHGLAISGSHWIFQGAEEDLTSQLNEGKRVVVIENDPLDQNIKKITSTVTWNFTENRPEEIKLISYLTNWQMVSAYCSGTCTPCSSFKSKGQCQNQGGCSWNGSCSGVCTPCSYFRDRNSCRKQAGCQWIQ